jgi:hypothetical protein
MKDFKFFQKEIPKKSVGIYLEEMIEARRQYIRRYERGEIYGAIDTARLNDSFTVINFVGTGLHELLNKIIDNE